MCAKKEICVVLHRQFCRFPESTHLWVKRSECPKGAKYEVMLLLCSQLYHVERKYLAFYLLPSSFTKKAENCEGLVKPMSERLDIQTAPAKDMNSLKRKTNH